MRCYEGKPIDGVVIERVLAATLFIPDAADDTHSGELRELKERGIYAKEYAEVLIQVLRAEGVSLAVSGVIVPVLQTTPRLVPAGPIALAHALSSVTGLRMKNTLVATREVRSQRGLGLVQRRENRRDSMRSIDSLSGMTVYLVDDVVTTGSTMLDAARAVKHAGAASAIGLAAGRDADIRSLVHAGVIRQTLESNVDFQDESS